MLGSAALLLYIKIQLSIGIRYYPLMLGEMLAETGDALVSVFFPGGCRLCERLLTRASRLPICEECLGAFPALSSRVCSICGSPTLAGTPLPQAGNEASSEDDGLKCLDCT